MTTWQSEALAALGDADRTSTPAERELAATKGKAMTDTNAEPSGAQRMFGDFAPGLVHFTDDVLFGEMWERPELSPRDRSLITVTALTTMGATEQLTFHIGLAKQNGVTEDEIKEAITHLAFYAGWPKAMSAMTVAKQVFAGTQTN